MPIIRHVASIIFVRLVFRRLFFFEELFPDWKNIGTTNHTKSPMVIPKIIGQIDVLFLS